MNFLKNRRPILRLFFMLAALLLSTAPGRTQAPLAISSIRLDEANRAVVRVPYAANSYFILYRGNDVATISTPTALENNPAFSVPLEVELIDELPPVAAPVRFYRVEQVLLSASKDLDGDGLDDAYELSYGSLLNALNAADALLDPDQDNLTTLAEYLRHTNPFIPNPPLPPASPLVGAPPQATTATFINLTGTGPTNTYIRIEGGAALATNGVAADGSFALTVPLTANRLNRLFASAVNSQGATSAGLPLEILQDSQPPTLFIDFPAATNGLLMTVDRTLVSGRVGDALSGYRGLNVWVHSSPAEGAVPTANTEYPTNSPFHAEVDVGIGPNGTYHRTNVPLAEGANTLTVIASDMLGNRTLRHLELIRQPLAGPRLLAVSGDVQTSNALRRLPEPLVVRVQQPDGTPLPGTVLLFEVTRSNGRLLPVDTNLLAADWTLQPTAGANGAMKLALRTDAAGEARAWWTVGSDAGSANNRVCVSSTSLSNMVFFCASATAHPARQINIGSGNNQKVETDAPVAEPLRVWVSDGLNPAPGTPVTFRVIQGGGKLLPGGRDGTPVPQLPNPQPTTELTIATGFTGHASVGFIAGPDGGQNLIEASFPGQFGLPATFVAYGVARNPNQPGSFTGLILDNTSRPIGGATVRLVVAHYDQLSASDTEGRFHFNDVPGGMGHLLVNGFTATTLYTNTIPTNSFPALGYAVVTVANAENSLPTPVLLPQLNPVNAQVYYGTNDLDVTCAGIAGLKMTIKANSMKHPDGARVTPDRPAYVSLNQVHHDDIPMPMPDGVAPPFAWTLQPGGATFDTDKPVRVEYPNISGLAPGSIAYFLSFNHDTQRFEIVSSGQVTDDGATIATDPNSGLTIAGWGCNCPPYSVAGNCQSPSACVPPVPTSNGCGAEASGGGNLLTNCGFLPASGLGIPATFYCFTTPCDTHDLCYGTCGNGKAQCDLNFLNDMLGVCTQVASNNPVGYLICEARATAYYNAVAIFGGVLAYTPAQAAACVCQTPAPNAAHLAHRRAARAAPLPPPYPDVDGDLLPDDWERANGLDPADSSDTFEDPDGDGLNNFKEFFLLLNPLVADTDSDGQNDFAEAEQISPPLNRPGRLDETWRVQVGAQSSFADVLGNFRVQNISAVDVLGVSPTDPPDFESDDLMRVVAVSSAGGNTRYATSGFFRLRQGQEVTVPPLTISDVPPQLPESLALVAGATLLVTLGDTTQVRAIARYADGTTAELNSPEVGTTFRVSNPAVATVDAQGKVTAIRAGRVLVSASNQGATGTVMIDIVPGSASTTVRGLVLNADGTPASGVLVTLTDLAAPPALTGADGRFEIAGASTALGLISVVARTSGPSGRLFAAVTQLTPVDSGTTEAGTLQLAAVPLAPRFLSGGSGHGLATRRDGSLWAWGNNDNGELGDGSRIARLNPVRIGSATDWVALASGEKHNLGLKTDGSLWAWGDGAFGQLGLGNLADQLAPTRVGTANDWKQVAACVGFSLALRTDGSLWVWGANSFGQLGLGNSVTVTQPTALLPGTTWRSVAGGRNHGLAVRADGTLWSWGLNGRFQLGDGTLNERSVPLQVGTESDWEAVTAAGESSLAIKQDGSLWGWGNNSGGQLGLGDITTRTTPTRMGAETDWWFVTSSANRTVAMKLDGSLWAWGFNNAGEVADVALNKILLPRRIEGAAPWQGGIAPTFGSHTLAVDRDGALFAWGYNHAGQLGIGRAGDKQPTPGRVLGDTWRTQASGDRRSAGVNGAGEVFSWGSAPNGDGTVDNKVFPFLIPNLIDPQSVAVGKHTLVVAEDGALWGWGENFAGQVGNGTRGNYILEPVRIGQRTDWRQVNASAVLSFAVAADGSLWSWGDNSSGQLGVGSTESASAPTHVTGLPSGLIEISAGEGFAIALRTDGTLWGWGDNTDGQLGDNSSNGRLVPAQIGTDSDWRAIAAGAYHVLAVKNDGSLWGWGRNQEYQLGDNTRTTRRVPTLNPRLTNVRTIDAGYQHALVIKTDGTLWAWGRNTYGEVGDGTTVTRAQPVPIGTDTDWVAVSAGIFHTLARKTDGTLWAWGDNELGALGTSRRYRVGTASDWGARLP